MSKAGTNVFIGPGKIVRRSVTSCYHGGKISGSQQKIPRGPQQQKCHPKATSRSLKLQRDYFNSLTLSIKYCRGRKRNLLSHVHMDDKT